MGVLSSKVQSRRYVLTSICVAALASQSAAAQSVNDTPGFSGNPQIEKILGEAGQIKERDRYFWRMRGVDLAQRAKFALDYSSQRAAAIDQMKAQIAALDDTRAAGSWTALGPAGATMLNWVMSPVSGRISAFAQSPTSENTLFVGGASGGVWRSLNGGSSWSAVFDNAGTQTIGSIWIEPGNTSRVWVGTGERGNSCVSYFGQGVFLSTDGGSNFAARNGSGSTALNLSHVTSISTSPSPTTHVLAAGTSFCNAGSQQSGGIFRSTDGGGSWTKVVQGAVEDVMHVRSNGQIAYAAQNGNGVLKSIDGGVSWQRLSSGLPAANIGTVRLAMAAYNSNLLYALIRVAPPGVAATTNLYRTTNAGTSWTQIKADVCDGQCDYNVTLDIDPVQNADPLKPNIVLGFIRPWLSRDGGTTFSAMTQTWGNTQQVHQDTHVVRFQRLSSGPLPNPRRLWIGGDGGLWRSDNLGSSYTNLNNGLALAQFYDIAVHPSTQNAVFGGTQDNSSMGRFGSNLWAINVVNGDGGTTLIDTGNTAIVYQFGYTPFNANGPTLPNLWRSGQNGAPNTFSQVSKTGLISGEQYSFITKGTNAAGWVFLASDSVYRKSSSSASNSWTKIANNLTGSEITVMTPARKLATDPLTLYVGDRFGRVVRLWNVTATNTPPSNNITGSIPSGVISDIAVDPSNLSRLFVSRASFGGSKLYYSGDQGATWIARGGGLPNVPANSVAVHPSNGAIIFVATDVGVYRSFDGGVSFSPYTAGMPLGSVAMDLEVQGSQGKLYVATYGRGVFVIDL